MSRAITIVKVASFELLESLQSRKAIVLLLLYMFGAVGASALAIRGLHSIQSQLAEQSGGAVTIATLMESPRMASLMGRVIGDEEIAKAVLSIPPLAIFYGWLSINFGPLLVLFTSSGAIAGDVASGAVRYSLFRVDRLSWATGKLLGQTLLMAVGVLLGALACWLTGMIWFEGMAQGETALWLLRLSGASVLYNFAYLGIALCASQLVRTGARAMALALALMFICSLVGGILQAPVIQKRAPEVFGALSKLFPNGHSLNLWHPAWSQFGLAALGLVAIGLVFFALGFLRFSRRDS